MLGSCDSRLGTLGGSKASGSEINLSLTESLVSIVVTKRR